MTDMTTEDAHVTLLSTESLTRMQLTAHSSHVYTPDAPPTETAAWLESRGFVRIPRTQREHARLTLRPPVLQRDWNAIVVIHHSGAMTLIGTEQGLTAMRRRIGLRSVNIRR